MALPAAALTTYEAAREWLGLPAEADRPLLERLIEAVSAAADRHCRRGLAWAEVTEQVPGYGTARVHVSRVPVLEVVRVEVDGEELPASAYRIESAERGTLYARNGWPWTAPLLPTVGTKRAAGQEERAIAVTYRGGYVTPGQVAGALVRTLPADLEQAVLESVAALYRGKARGGEGRTVQAESLGGYSVTYALPGPDSVLTASSRVALAPYGRKRT